MSVTSYPFKDGPMKMTGRVFGVSYVETKPKSAFVKARDARLCISVAKDMFETLNLPEQASFRLL